MNKLTSITVAALLLASGGGRTALHAADAPVKPIGGKPNILVILADDMGFSDLGCYGSEIETPNLDKLASTGLRFTQFYNTAKCHSSRVSLMTGRYPYQAGNIGLSRAITVPEVLGAAGYFTAMTGKWHLDKEPTNFGFQRYFGHLSGSCSYFKGNDTFRLNGQPWTVPAQGFYTTVANVDHALNFLGEARGEKKPWFLYVAFNAPHTPLQPLAKDYKKYLGRYDAGWDVLRAARAEKQKQLGLFGRDIEPAPRPDHIPAWKTLKPEMRAWEARRMAAYAGLVDRLDQEVGRLLENLRAAGELDNTFILFVSDNGADPRDYSNEGKSREPYDPTTHWTRGTGWAWMSNTPFRFYKQNQFEGGIATPAIVHWPKGLKTQEGAKTDVPVHLVDVLPTLAEVSGASIPVTWPGREPSPLAGVSFGPVLTGGTLPTRPLYFLYNTDRGLRVGDWKLVSFRGNPWELYNLANDRTELHNLASQQPERLSRLAQQWFQMANEVDKAPPQRQTPVLETAQPYIYKPWSTYGSEQANEAKKDQRKNKKSASASEEAEGE